MVVAWQPGKTATKPETSVQDRVSTFVSTKTLNTFSGTLAQFPVVIMETKLDTFHEMSGLFSAVLAATRPDIFKGALCLNLSQCRTLVFSVKDSCRVFPDLTSRPLC